MKLAFNVDTTCIYADDDPEYIAGAKPEEYHLTPEQEELRRVFMAVLVRVKRAGHMVDVDRLIEAMRDYIAERRIGT